MTWKPAKTLGLCVGLIIAATLVGLDVFLVRSVRSQKLDLNVYATALLCVISLPVLAVWAYWYFCLLTLRYTLDRNALVIVCGFARHSVPMTAIQCIVPGREVTVVEGLRGLGWPGYIMGMLRLERWGPLLIYSTEPLERQLIVVTATTCYGLSPWRPAEFLADFAARRALGPIRPVEQKVEYAPVVMLPIWRERWFWVTLALAVAANVVLFGWVAYVYAGLPERIPLYFDVQGRINRIAAKEGLLLLPVIGTLTWAANGTLGLVLHQHERLAAFLLILMALAIQVVLWLATRAILAR